MNRCKSSLLERDVTPPSEEFEPSSRNFCYITLHYITFCHFKHHLHLKWPVVHQQLHVLEEIWHQIFATEPLVTFCSNSWEHNVFEVNEQAVREMTDGTKPAVPVRTLDLCSKNLMESNAVKEEIGCVWSPLEDRPAFLEYYAQGNL